MSLIESIKGAFSSLFASKMRTFLTMLGIIIGIGSVIMITSVGRGSQSKMVGELSKLGTHKLTIYLKERNTASQKDLFTEEDEVVLKQHPEVQYVSPQLSIWGSSIKLRNRNQTKQIQIQGVNESYHYIETLELTDGRFLVEGDNKAGSQVVLIDDTLAQKVFGRTNVLGEKISFDTYRGVMKCTIVGIIKNPNAMFENMFGSEFPSTVYMPIKTVQKKFWNEIDNYLVAVKDPDKMEETGVSLTKLLERKHRNMDKYYVNNAMKNLEEVNKVLGMLTAFVSFVASISLIVGGVGVMNIMLVTVTERTREIGIRKSLGAKNKDILIQFLIEAVILTVIGGVIGILLGYGGGLAIGNFLKISPQLSFGIIFGTFLICSIIGIVFGVYPARKASKLDPIEALRYE